MSIVNVRVSVSYIHRWVRTQQLIWNLFRLSAVDQLHGNQSGRPKWGQVDACGLPVIMRRKQSMWLGGGGTFNPTLRSNGTSSMFPEYFTSVIYQKRGVYVLYWSRFEGENISCNADFSLNVYISLIMLTSLYRKHRTDLL